MTWPVRPRVRHTPFALLLAFSLAQCDSPAHDVALPATDIIARLEPAPSVVIGEELAEDAPTFTNTAGPFRLSDGTIVVANKYSPPAVYFFSNAGKLLRTVGREGAGPGEFRSINWIRRLNGDTVLVFDSRLARLTRIAPDGQIVGTQQLPQTRFGLGSTLRLLGVFADGSGLAGPSFSFSVSASGSGRSKLTLMNVNLVSGLPRRIAEFPGTEYVPRGSKGRAMSLIFGKSTAVEMVGDRIFVLTGDELRADEYNSEGALLRSVVAPFEPRRVAKGDVDSEIERTIAAFSIADREPARQEAREIRNDLVTADFFPATGSYSFGAPGPSLIVDDQGRIWVLEYVAPRDTIARWVVFSPEGQFTGRVIAPAAFWITDIRDSSALGVYRDPDGVNSVRIYSVH